MATNYNQPDGPDAVGPQMGQVREGTIVGYDIDKGTVEVNLTLSKPRNRPVTAPIPSSWTGPFGEFSGGFPALGSAVWCAQGMGGQWAILGYGINNDVFGNNNTFDRQGFVRNRMAALESGRWLTQVRNNVRMFCDPDEGIQIGNPNFYLQAEPSRSIISTNFRQSLGFTEAHRSISGVVRRDMVPNSNRDVTDSALTDQAYDQALTSIGLDPIDSAGKIASRNPPFVERREIVYEFANSFGFTNDRTEIPIYDNDEVPAVSANFKRSDSRTDVLNLSLEEPNLLIESVTGTLVDIYGNLLDLNRQVLPSGSTDALSFSKTEGNLSETFNRLREQARKTVAYHWELNARKDITWDIFDVNDAADYGRNRSRFFLDIDKEGQFKLNVPASSEVGTVPVLVRYENYQRVNAAEEDTDPTEFIRNEDDIDVLVDGFGKPAVSLTTEEGDETGLGGPTDRISGDKIKLGTAYHDISLGLFLHKVEEPVIGYEDSVLNDPSKAPAVEKVVSEEIFLGGDTANVGGRSGTITCDGSLSLSLGANTSDRQSLWLDCAGGIVSNVGRDIRNVSYAGTMDGDVFIQLGGSTIGDDTRFEDLNNASRDATFDLRILTGNQMHILRFDPEGLTIYTPQRIDIVADGEMRFKSTRGRMTFDAESIYFYANETSNGRLVNRKPGQTI
jgi:hypothetical protein